MASSNDSSPFYTTVWFGILFTVLAVGALYLIAIAVPDVGGRPNKGIGQFGVVLIAIYWVIIFPKLRRIRQNQASVSSDSGKDRKNH
ncbi:MAG TPA: hypothetical protein VMB03_10915 [Bryobacteraceae bacterium]|nr:hypothetical protein [Bryobacteraceae bacterium]